MKKRRSPTVYGEQASFNKDKLLLMSEDDLIARELDLQQTIETIDANLAHPQFADEDRQTVEGSKELFVSELEQTRQLLAIRSFMSLDYAA